MNGDPGKDRGSKRLAWLTDLHLNFARRADLDRVTREIRLAKADAVLVGGDIAEAATFAEYLTDLAAAVELPVHFVLGNHDYYGSSIAAVREAVRKLSRESPWLQWLPDAGVVQLTAQTSLIGHGGWGDGRLGDIYRSPVVLNDFLLIDELRETHHAAEAIVTPALIRKLRELGDEAAESLRQVLPAALATSEHVLVLTHVPPFREACWHEGRLSDDDWAPHFTCKAVGDVLVEFMRQQPDKRMTVYCGHTHGAGAAQILPNLAVFTGHAQYGRPELQQVLEVA